MKGNLCEFESKFESKFERATLWVFFYVVFPERGVKAVLKVHLISILIWETFRTALRVQCSDENER